MLSKSKKINYSLYNVCTAKLHLSDSIEVLNFNDLFEKIAVKHDLIYVKVFTYKHKDAKLEPCSTLYLMIT